MEDQDGWLWESWDCDTSWDHTDDACHYQQQPEIPHRSEPISNLSSFLVEDEDSKHLFAASMFRSSLRSSNPYMEYDGDWSVDSDCTVQASNKNKASEPGNSALTVSCQTPLEENTTAPSAPTKQESTKQQPDQQSESRSTKISSIGNEQFSDKHGLPKISLSDSLIRYSDSRQGTQYDHGQNRPRSTVALPFLDELLSGRGKVTGGGRARAA